MSEKRFDSINVWEIQDQHDLYWTHSLRGMLGMIDQIMRFDGRDEEKFKERIAEFMWKVVQANLHFSSSPRHEDECERCGTVWKFRGEPGISHLVSEAYPRVNQKTRYWEEQRRLKRQDPSIEGEE